MVIDGHPNLLEKMQLEFFPSSTATRHNKVRTYQFLTFTEVSNIIAETNDKVSQDHFELLNFIRAQ